MLKRGLRPAWRAVQRALRWEFHRRFDADVGGLTYLDDLGIDEQRGVFYQGSAWLPTLRALKRLGAQDTDVVADLGAGKGLGVLLASELPVKRVIGVELADALAAVARRNVARNASRRRCEAVGIVTGDVLEWPVPDDLTVAYMYCPFLGDVFVGAMARLIDSYDRHPRRLRIVYNYPWEHNRLLATGRVRVVDVAPAQWPVRPRWWERNEVIVTYEVTPSGQRPADKPPGGTRGRRAALARWSRASEARFSLERPGHQTIYSHPA